MKNLFKEQYNDLEGSVTLPIQSGITDSNLVKWGPNELDAINAFASWCFTKSNE